ncbi:hypothetical protein GCM10027535_05010 [Mycolicibacterium hippocampi]|uniref:Pyridoxamine 5'-phosphate oxidase N-terminal domain-containing protein n=1 Tax=Mycolicibacterium hippocampi TaxID=659824 RepID=A0A7I9ZL17_9MYCO|nr:hypothetical protein MHIP_18600 [Mycolicibacterium hippocampi]
MITREVEASAVADLAFAPPRAALAAVLGDEIHLLPIRLTVGEPGDPASSPRLVQVPDDTPDLDGHDVVTVADDGPQWFRLRSLTVRGTATAVGDQSYRVTARRVVGWDYGALRRTPAPSPNPNPRPTSLTAVDHQDVNPCSSPHLDAELSTARVMILATRSPSGMPFAVPLWCVPHEGRIYATTAASSWTIRNVSACPQVAVLLGGDDAPDPGRLLVRGHARAHQGFPPLPVLARIAWRYYLQPQFAVVELSHLALWPRRMKYYAQSKPAHLVITPQSATECRVP